MKGWSHWSIGQRLGLGFLLLLLINTATVLVVYRLNARSERAEAEFATGVAPRLEAALQLRGRILGVAVAARAFQIARTQENRIAFAVDLQVARAQLDRLSSLNVGDRAFAALAQQIGAYLGAAEQTIIDGLGDDAQQALRDRRLGLMDDMDEYIERHRTAVAAAMNAMSNAQQRVRDSVLTASIVSLLTFLLIALLIAESIRRPSRNLLKAARAMGDSDWRPALALSMAPSDERSGNELVQLGKAFRHAASAIELRERRLEAGRAVASAAAGGLSAELIAGCALQTIGDHVGAELGVVYVNTPDAPMRPVATRGLGIEPHELAPAQGIPLDCAREGRTIQLDAIPVDAAFHVRIGFDSAPARGVIAVPMKFRDRVVGVLVLASLRTFVEDHVRFLESAAEQLAIGFENVHAFTQIRELLAQTTIANAKIQTQSEELQAQNEELQAQAEEIQVQNEELQAQSEEIRAQNDDLLLQSETLRAQQDALAQVDTRKNDFIGMLAHELRNPLATISNSLFVLRESGVAHGASDRTLDIMQRQMRQLQRLTDDLLDITRIAKGKLKLRREWVDLAEVVRECVEDQRISAARSGVRLTLTVPEQPIRVYGDRSRLSQVLCNLIDNAVKASAADSDVQIAVNLHAEPSRATVHIADRGEGIPQDVLPTLFRPFVQAFGSRSSNGGLGLGLSLVDTITGMHGGTVEAFSEGIGLGSVFVVTLPLETPTDTADGENGANRDTSQYNRKSERTETGTARRKAGGRASRVQIIEDNVDAAETLRCALELAGHEVMVAHTAESGIHMVQTTRPDVLICDIGLPDASGYEIAARLSRDPRCAAVRLVALTGYATPADYRRAIEAGFHHHFAKPVTIEELGTVLRPSSDTEAHDAAGRDPLT